MCYKQTNKQTNTLAHAPKKPFTNSSCSVSCRFTSSPIMEVRKNGPFEATRSANNVVSQCSICVWLAVVCPNETSIP